MSLSSMTGALQILRSRLLTFTPATGSTLATLLGSTTSGAGSDGKLYLNQAPDNLTGFYGVLRLIDAPQTGMDGGFLMRCTAELILYGRPRNQQSAVERMADVVQQAWLWYGDTEVNGVLITDRVINRFTIPYEEPADRELVAVRMLLPFRLAPQYLVQYGA
jgi:hypothetical protein